MAELIYERINKIMADVPAIPKGQRNQQQGYAFRGIDDLYNALHGLFAKHEVVILPEVLEADYIQQLGGRDGDKLMTDARLRVRFTFVTTDGSSVSIITQGESRDYADKATNQAMSSGFKYGLLQMFLIPLADVVDPDSVSPEIAKPKVKPKPAAKKLTAKEELTAAKVELVKIMGDKDDAAAFWHTHEDTLDAVGILQLAFDQSIGKKEQ